MGIHRWWFLVPVMPGMKIHSVIMNINIKAVSAHTLITMKMSPTVFIQAVMQFWFRQDLNHAGLHS